MHPKLKVALVYVVENHPELQQNQCCWVKFGGNGELAVDLVPVSSIGYTPEEFLAKARELATQASGLLDFILLQINAVDTVGFCGAGEYEVLYANPALELGKFTHGRPITGQAFCEFLAAIMEEKGEWTLVALSGPAVIADEVVLYDIVTTNMTLTKTVVEFISPYFTEQIDKALTLRRVRKTTVDKTKAAAYRFYFFGGDALVPVEHHDGVQAQLGKRAKPLTVVIERGALVRRLAGALRRDLIPFERKREAFDLLLLLHTHGDEILPNQIVLALK